MQHLIIYMFRISISMGRLGILCMYWFQMLVWFAVGGWGGESFVTPPTGKSCFVFVFALRACVRACVRDATRDHGVSRHVFVAASSPSPAPGRASRYCKTAVKSIFSEQVVYK